MQVHILHQNVLDTVVILEEGTPPHPRCTQCNMLVHHQALNFRHPATAQCSRGAEEAAASGGGSEGKLQEDLRGIREPLENVTKFRYLRQMLTVGENSWLTVVSNLGKARNISGRLSWILIREGAETKVSGKFYKAVVQAVLLFEAEM